VTSRAPFSDSAIEARARALRLTFAPFLFQAVCALRDFGILAHAWERREHGVTRAEAARKSSLSEYAATVLLEAGLAAEVFTLEGDTFHLTRTGYFLVGDEMTRVNLEFARDVCYRALEHLPASLREGRPVGLKELGEGPFSSNSLYEDFAGLSPRVTESWLAFDHYYSSVAFEAALDRLLSRPITRVVDIGANTGKFAHACLVRNQSVRVVLVDHPRQLELAKRRLEGAGLAGRADFVTSNLLSDAPLPASADVVWLSQVVDCLSEDDAVRLLTRVKATLAPEGRVFVLEPCWDLQPQRAGKEALTLLSLYFTCAANGKSRMYDSVTLQRLFDASGLVVEKREDGLGVGHSLFECSVG
jgi:SAM-dependent methyltransferase